VLTLSGVVGDGASTYALTKVGEGVVSLTGTNTYGGDTVIEEGVLRVTTGSLPGGYDTSNTGNDYGAVNLAGGVLELASGTNFTRSVGTGEEQIFWSGDGGFSASGGDRTVTLDGGTMTWGSGSFVPTGNALLLSSNYSDATVTFTNALALGSEVREVRVANGSAAVDGALSGNISGAGGILKTGEGTLNLAGGTKNYSGATVIREGAVRGSTGSNSNIQLEGGVRELAGGYSDNLGTTGGLIQWTGDGGLAADTTNRTFNVGGNNQTLTWGGTTGNSQYFVDDGDVLILGSRSTAALLTFDNAINLDGAERTIQVIDSASVAEEAILNRDVSGGDLRVIGDGSLGITVNTSLAGAVTVEGATLRVRNNGRLDNVSGVTIKNGGALLLDSSASATDRLANSAPVTMNGGTLGFYGRTSDNNSTETIGAVTLQGGGNTIDVVNNRSGRSTELTSASLTRNDGATVDFTNSTTTNGTYGTGNTPRLTFTAAPTLTNGILAYATVNGSAFATLSGNRIVAAASADGSPWVGTFNVTLDSASGALGGATDREVNSVRLSGSGTSTVAFEGRNLDIVSGGVLSTGTGANSFTGAGTLTSSSGELIVHTYGTAGMNIGVTITNSGVNPVALTKTGNSTLTLSGSSANTYTGLTRVNDGTLILSKDAGIAAIGGDLQIGDGRGVDTVRFINNEQLSINTDVTLSGGLTGAAASTNNIAVLDLNGTTQSFDGLTIIGNSVIDFSGGDPCAPTFLNINSLTFVGDATLTIKNWIEFTDFFLIADNASVDFARITFEGYGGQAGWQDYSTGWKQITPVPEPSSYGAIFLGGAAALMLLRRRPRGTQQR
jgi:autotransporter-associated beta strand protein